MSAAGLLFGAIALWLRWRAVIGRGARTLGGEGEFPMATLALPSSDKESRTRDEARLSVPGTLVMVFSFLSIPLGYDTKREDWLHGSS